MRQLVVEIVLAARVDGDHAGVANDSRQIVRLGQTNRHPRCKDELRMQQHENEKNKEDAGKCSDIKLAAKDLFVARKPHAFSIVSGRPFSVTIFTISDAAFSISSTMEFTRPTR